MKEPPRWREPAVAACAAVLTFLPVLRHGFVNWDDDVVLSHPMLGSLDPRWMLSSLYSNTWQPLTWLVDSLIVRTRGLDPSAFHAANLVLDALAAALFALLARRLLELAAPGDRRAADGALFAGLLFAVHPLSAEPAAWISAKGDLLASVFVLAAAFVYVDRKITPRRLAAVWGLFVLSALSRWKGVAFPVLLLILDEYPLRRRALLEKLPFFAVSAAIVALNAAAKAQGGGYAPVPRPLEAGAAALLLAAKWLAPFRLMPVYALDASVGLEPAVLALLLTAGFVATRRRWPAALAAWTFFLASVAPVLLFSAAGEPLVVHDYHAYLACAGFTLLAGAGLSRVPWAGWALAAALAFNARAQARTWSDSETLWRRAAAVDPSSRHALFRLSLALQENGKLEEALAPARRLYAIDPARGRRALAGALTRLGLARAAEGKRPEALAALREARELAPESPETAENLRAAELASKKR